MTITFKEFIKDYCKYYNEKEVIVRDNSEMQEVLYELYDNDVFEVNYDEKIIELCDKYSVSYVDFYSLPLNNKNLFVDGIHLNVKGNDLMFKHAVKAIKVNT